MIFTCGWLIVQCVMHIFGCIPYYILLDGCVHNTCLCVVDAQCVIPIFGCIPY